MTDSIDLEIERAIRRKQIEASKAGTPSDVTVTKMSEDTTDASGGMSRPNPYTAPIPAPIEGEMSPVIAPPVDTSDAGIEALIATKRAKRLEDIQKLKLRPGGYAYNFPTGPMTENPTTESAMDALNMPSRALAAGLTDQKFADKDAYLAKKPTEYVKNLIDENVPPGSIVSPGVMKVGAELIGRTLSDPLTYAGGVGAIRQGFKMGARAEAKGLIPSVRTLQGVGAATKTADKVSPIYKLAEELTGVPHEALKLASTKEGRSQLEFHAGKLREYAGDLISHIEDNPIASLPERAQVAQALQKMPEINIESMFQKMRDVKDGRKAFTGEMKKAQELIDADIQTMATQLRDISGGKEGQFFKTKLSAEDVYDFRKQLDAITNFDLPALGLTQKAADYVNKARMAARTELKTLLEKSAVSSGIPEYPALMKSYSEKLNKLEEIQKVFGGGTGISREDKAVNLLRKAANQEGEGARKELMAALDAIFGSDFTTKTKLSVLSDALGPGGKATNFPRHTTGRSLLALATAGSVSGALPVVPGAVAASLLPAAALASPKIFTRVTVPAARAIKNALTPARAARIKSVMSEGPKPKMIEKLIKLGITEAEINAALQTAE